MRFLKGESSNFELSPFFVGGGNAHGKVALNGETRMAV